MNCGLSSLRDEWMRGEMIFPVSREEMTRDEKRKDDLMREKTRRLDTSDDQEHGRRELDFCDLSLTYVYYSVPRAYILAKLYIILPT